LVGSLGAYCQVWQKLFQAYKPTDIQYSPWYNPSWEFTGKFKIDNLDGSDVSFDIYPNMFSGQTTTSAIMDMAPSGTACLTSQRYAPQCTSYSWQPNTWYWVEWVWIWGDQQRVRVWPVNQDRPEDWLVTAYGWDVDPTAYDIYFAVSYASPYATTSAYFDDFSFGQAPILPTLPMPEGTDHNPPYGNEDEAGDPVNTFTGSYSDTHLDIAIPGRGPAIAFSRTYNSNDTRVSSLGPGWTHSYNTRLASPGDDTDDVILIGPQGRSDRYVWADGGYTPPKDVYVYLVQNGDGSYTAADKSGNAWLFDQGGKLLQLLDRYGNHSDLAYDNEGRLLTVSDPAGRGSLSFGYSGDLLISVTDWLSPPRTVRYIYYSDGRLASVLDRETKSTSFGYDGTSHRITAVRDGRGNVILSLAYDSDGRVSTQKDALGLTSGDYTSFAYVEYAGGSRETTVSIPSTSFEPSFRPSLTDTYTSDGWLAQRTTRPSSTETLTQSFTYDSSGNRTSATDARGNRTDFCYDVDYTGHLIGTAGNLTRVILPPRQAGDSRATSLMRYDAHNNVVQTVAAGGVPSGASVDCSTDLSAVATAYVTDFAYNSSGIELLSGTSRFTDPERGLQTAVVKYEYGDTANPGRVTRTIPPRGNSGPSPDYSYATTSTYYTSGSQAGKLKDVTDPLGNRTAYSYDPAGRVTAVVDPLGNVPGAIAADHTTQYTYDKEDRVRIETRPAPTPGGRALTTETRYDAVGRPIVRIDANGQVTTYTYDQRYSLTQIQESPLPWTDPAAPPATLVATGFDHDAAGNVTRVTRARGDGTYERATDYVFDGRGLVRRETQYPSWPSTGGTLVTTWTYDPAGNPLTVVDPAGRTTTYAHDARDAVTSIDYSDPATPDVAYSYDANGNRSSMSDGTGASTYTYDEADRLISTTNSAGKTVGYRYDLSGNRTRLIYPDGTSVAYAFDKGDELSSLTDWASRAVGYTYWADGALKTATNVDGSMATYAYDNVGRLTDLLDQRGSTTISRQSYRLDGVGNIVAQTDLVSGVTQAATWQNQAPLSDVTAGDQTQPAIASAADGTAYAVWADSRSGNSDIYFSRRDPVTGAWGVSERVNSVTTGAQTQPALAIDSAGNAYVVWADARLGAADDDIYFSKRAAASGQWSASARVNDDRAGKRQYDPSIAISASGNIVAVWYDERGGKKYIYSARLAAGSSAWSANIAVTSDFKAVKAEPEVAVGPDGTGYAVWRDHRSGNADIWFASLSATGSAWSASTKLNDDTGKTAQDAPDIAVDSAGNILTVWNDARISPSQIRARRRPAGSTTWAASVALGGSTSSSPTIQARADGRAYAAWFNGTAGSLTTVWGSEYDPTTASWTAAERLTDPAEEAARPAVLLTATQLLVAYQRRAPGGNYDIYGRRKPLAGDEYAFAYDRLYRLTSVAGPDGSRSYTYDPAGNRLSRVVSGTSTSYTYDRADRLTSAGSAGVTVDANGNLTAKGSDSFGFDQANQLTRATVSGTTETYTYDGDGTRATRQVGSGPVTQYVADVANGLPVTIDDGVRKYVYGNGLAYAVSGSSVEVYHADGLGSVRALTDASGTIVAAYRTDEWGVPTVTTGSSSQPLGFTGEPKDGTGLTYLRARYYDPSLGRFLSRDTWPGSGMSPITLNRYAYANDNPTTNTDHSGHFIDTIADIGFIFLDIGSLVFGPEKDRGANWAALGLDAAAAFIPGVTGAGLVARGWAKAGSLFSKLSHASTYGIRSYKNLNRVLKGVRKAGTYLEAHHLVEKRFARILGVNENDMLAIAVTEAEHQVFTNKWRHIIPYGTTPTRQEIDDAARWVYKGYPEILQALGL
jgi:RHS repeat-associated protein